MLELIVIYLACSITGFIVIKKIAAYNKKIGIIGLDINKKNKPKVAESTGIGLLAPLWGISLALFFSTGNINSIIWAVMATGFSAVGYLDDTKHKFSAKTIPWRLRASLIAIISLLFAFIFFNTSLALIIIAALFIAGLASFENTFAGLNGWEIGSGFIISAFIALTLFGSSEFLLAIALNAAILALLFLNWFPAKIFPGDSGTLLIGSAAAGLIVIQGSLHLMALTFLFFIPHLIDFGLKLATNPSDPSQRKELPYKLGEDEKLRVPESGRLDFAKLLIKVLGPMKEKHLVWVIWLVVLANCLFWYFLFFRIF